jgi:iron(III) transport system substrate-binding protein
VKKDELPKTYHDLLDPKWKGRLAVESEDHGWFATVLEGLGEQQGLKLFNDIVATNGISVRKGHSLLGNLVASGEVPLALSSYNWKPEQLKQKGAPIDWVALPPVVAQLRTIAMLKKAPHPNAAVLFYDFMLTEAQPILAARSLAPTSKKIETPLSKLQLKFIDPARALDMQEKWMKTYEEVITKRAKQ